MCFENGGASFLIPYIVMLLVVGLPAMLIELSAGQYARVGANKVFGRMVPAFKGKRQQLKIKIVTVSNSASENFLRSKMSLSTFYTVLVSHVRSWIRDVVGEVLCECLLRDRVRLGALLHVRGLHLSSSLARLWRPGDQHCGMLQQERD